MAQHVLAVGQSGVGKTTLFYNVMDQLTVPFWVFDLKQDYRHLMQHDDELLVLPWTELKFNPLQPPPGVPPRRWAQVFSEIFGHATALLSGSKNYLMKQLIELYQRYGLFDAVEPPYPSFHELQHVLEEDEINYVRKTANYRDTVVNRLEAMNLTAGTIFDGSTGYPLEMLLERNVVFEFDGLSTDLQNFLMEILFAAVYEYRVAQNQRGGDLRHVFFLDEGKQVFSVYKERQDAAGIPAIDKLTAKMREFGEGLVVADQEATKLTDSIKANTNTTLLLATGDAVQFTEVAESMNLTARQQEVAQTLGVGEAIIQTGRRDPCPVLLKNYELEKTVSDTELRKRQQQEWNAFSATPRKPIAKVAEEVSQSDQDAVDIPDDPIDTTVTVSDRAEQLLTDIVQRPFVTVTNRYDRFSSVHQGNEAKQELLEASLVKEQQVTTATGTRTLFELTETGREYAETCLEVDAKQRGRGGITHRYWQHRLTELFNEAGWSAKRELFDADVYVNLHDAEFVIEVAMAVDDREVDHVEQHLETGFDRIWVVCRNAAVRDGLQERLQENGLLRDCVDLRLLQDLRSMDDLSL